MKKVINKTIIAACSIALIFTSSCEKFVGGDTNIDPNKAREATLGTLLPVVEEATADNHYKIANITGLFAQQLAAYSSGPLLDDQHRDVRMNTAFTGIYQNALTNLDVLANLASEKGAPHYLGIARILQTINLGLATDVWGDVPFTEAFQGAANLYPKYDSQQTLYTLMDGMLDQAIVELQKPRGTTPTAGDLIYNGDAAKWIKTAWVLKARYAMHLTKKGPVAAANKALSFLNKGYTSNAEDMQLVYNDRNLNPWNKNIAVQIQGANYRIAHSAKLINAMNGTSFPGLVDPRLPIIADKRLNAQFRGIQNGSGVSGTVDLTNITFYAKPAAPLMMVTYAEQKFLEAEAEFLAAGGTTTSTGSNTNGYNNAYNAYSAGITASMDKLGVLATDRDNYKANALVSPGVTGLKLENILREKHVATFLHPEAWVDVRRYDYNPALFVGMTLPTSHNPDLAGQFIRRALYPLEELNRNPSAQAAEKTLTTKVWWDQ